MNLDKLRRLRERYEAALDQAESRRAEYHQAIGELHGSGVPLREIASGLGLSHQRVHQIVGAARDEESAGRKASTPASETA